MTERDTAANVRRQMPAVTTTAAGATAELRAHHYTRSGVSRHSPAAMPITRKADVVTRRRSYERHAVGCRAPDCSCCSGLLSQLHPHRRRGHHDTERQCLHLAARSGLDTVSATPSPCVFSPTHLYAPPPSDRPSTVRRKSCRCWRTCEAARIDNELPTCT